MKKIKILTSILSLPMISTGLIPLTSCGNKDGTTGDISCITTKTLEIYEGTTTDFKFKFEAKPYDNKVTVQIENASATQPQVEFKNSSNNSTTVETTVDNENKFTLHIGFVQGQTTTCESKFNLTFSYKKDDTQPTTNFKIEGFSLKYVDPTTVQHTIKFGISGSGRLEGDLVTKVVHGIAWADVKKPTPVDSTNLVFVGWYNGDTQMGDADLVKSDLNITAKFVSCTPTTCFNFSHGQDGAKIVSCNQSIQSYQDIIVPECVTIDGTTYKVTEIKSNAFEQYASASMENITLSKYVKKISSNAFKNCINLKTITFNSYLETIEANAFSGCTALEKAIFSNNYIWGQKNGESHVNTLTPTVNATNFKNSEGTSPTGTNWGATGLYSEKAGITSLTVTPPTKTTYNACDKLNLTGMVVKANWTDERTPTDVTSQCTTNPDINTPLTINQTKVKVTHSLSTKVCEFNITINVSFQIDTWTNVINYANQGGLAKLKEVYHVETFIGLERKVIINSKEHTVRVIGEEHDWLANGQGKAALTFELVTLLSDSNGNAMKCKWDSYNNHHYTGSMLRDNLTGQGSGKSFSSTVISMLPSELQSGIKTVKKEVAESLDGTLFNVEAYEDTLFPLTYTEMDQPEYEYAKVEGTAYKYWTDHNTNNDRIKKDVAGSSSYYWLVSPHTHTTGIGCLNNAFGVDTDGAIFSEDVEKFAGGVSFGFCI